MPLFVSSARGLFLLAFLAHHVGCAQTEQHGNAAAQRGAVLVISLSESGQSDEAAISVNKLLATVV